MSPDWQTVVTLLLVALAGVYLARRTWRFWKVLRGRKAGCGDCGAGGGARRPVKLEPTRRREDR